MKFNEFREPFYIVWNLISICMVLFLVVLFVLDSSLLLVAAPICPSKLKGTECMLCGMTRAFLKIKEGDFSLAYQFNRGSIILFSLIVVNSIIFISEKIINHKKL